MSKKKKPKRAKRYAQGYESHRRSGRVDSPRLNPDGIDIPIQVSIDSVKDRPEDVDGMEQDDFSRQFTLEMHPDLLEIFDAGDLPDKAIDEQGNEWNVNAHLSFHTIVENQLAQDAPSGIVKQALKMESDGILGSHDVRHVIANAFAAHFSEMNNEDRAFDEQQYLAMISESYAEFCATKE